MSNTSEQFKSLRERRQRWVSANRENGFEDGLKRLLTELYPDNAHFIYELLQNADDAQAQEVQFILYGDCIEFEHDGNTLFSFQNVDAITSIGFSTKRDDHTRIGKFGVGFKAVFAYTNTPEIKSGKFHFSIADMVVPKALNSKSCNVVYNKTQFVLPFNNTKKSPLQARNEIEKLLKELDANTLLFLKYIRKIEYILPDSSLGYIEKIERTDNKIEICVKSPVSSELKSVYFMKFDKKVTVEDGEAAENKNKECHIAVAFSLSSVENKVDAKKQTDDSEKSKYQWELTSVEPRGNICIYFPAIKETPNLKFHLHAPFASTVARDSVRDCDGNNELRDHLAELLAESMHKLRGQGLLTVKSLGVLPNDKDNLDKFYKPLMDRLVHEFNEQPLIPMKKGGYAAASQAFRGSRALSDLINDNDLVMLLDKDCSVPLWVANPSLINGREDNYLSMLAIKEWKKIDFAITLCVNKDKTACLIKNKDERWHVKLYEYFDDDAQVIPILKFVEIVKTQDGSYKKGCECYFHASKNSNLNDNDNDFPKVDINVCTVDGNENKKVCNFLLAVGVRNIDERAEVEFLLKKYYSDCKVSLTMQTHFEHMQKFINFSKSQIDNNKVFNGYYFIIVDDVDSSFSFAHVGTVFLDVPYFKSGICSWYNFFKNNADKFSVSKKYLDSKINPIELGVFLNNLGATTNLQIKKRNVPRDHPEWSELSNLGGDRWRDSSIEEDYYIPQLTDFLKVPSLDKSYVMWMTMKSSCASNPSFINVRFGRNSSNIVTRKSSLIHDLINSKWIPQNTEQGIFFVKPSDALSENIPQEFEYQDGCNWLAAIHFGNDAIRRKEILQQILKRKSEEYNQKKEFAQMLGYDSPEEAEELAKLKREDPEGFRRWKESQNKPKFPVKPVSNLDRRKERQSNNLAMTPEKSSENRIRSVSTNRLPSDEIMTWLREKYTNDESQMVCQICKEEHFHKRNGSYYFEKKEILTCEYLQKDATSNYLALCPLCAAKYKEFINSDDFAMSSIKEIIINNDNLEVSILLEGRHSTISFVEEHYIDLKNSLIVNDSI